jgi:hypothetical protein
MENWPRGYKEIIRAQTQISGIDWSETVSEGTQINANPEI